MTESPYAIPAEELVASARIALSEQVEVQAVPDVGRGGATPWLNPVVGGGEDVDGDC